MLRVACSDTLENRIATRLASSGKTLATAESCSGGLIAHRVTNIPGSSAYFLGGVVAYSNAAKISLLGVEPIVLEQHGAVSEPVVRQMAEGARVRFQADYAVAVTGIAGPGGGTPSKPVGLVFIAVAGPGETRVEQHQFSGDRAAVKAQTAEAALHLILETV